jgi:L-ribulose-5-phosphate 3-epimerase
MEQPLSQLGLEVTRRRLLAAAAIAGAGAMLRGNAAWGEAEPGTGAKFSPPVALFSKVCQQLKLDFEQSADLAAEAGFDGLDVPVRPDGEIKPEHAVDELPRYAGVLAKRKLALLLVTSGIVSVSSPDAEEVLTTVKKLGVTRYRIGFIPPTSKIPEITAQLKELAALNKQLGMTGLLENHSKPPYLGGDLNQMYEVVKEIDPDQIGVAFDVGHAIIMHGDDWTTRFEQIKAHIRVAYIKDVRRPDKWVPFGKGELPKTDFFKRLRTMNLTAPMSLHIEFDWSDGGKNKAREGLLAAAKASNQTLHQWLADA